MVGEPSLLCVLLHRSRRQHFSPCFFRGRGVINVAELPAQTRALWPKLSEVQALSADSSGDICPPSASQPPAKRRKG